MGLGIKIRTLLLLLGICCIVTAISINRSLTQTSLLNREAAILQKNIAAREQQVVDFLSQKSDVDLARSLSHDGEQAVKFAVSAHNRGIILLTYTNNKLNYWSSSHAIPKSIASIREGTSFLELPNGYYECIKKTTGNFTALFLITVKDNYAIQNQYLKNVILPELSPSGVLDIALFSDKSENIRSIENLAGRFIFSVKLIPDSSHNVFSSIEITLWIFGLFFICLFVNSVASMLASKGHLYSGTLILTLFFLAFRLSDLQFGWFNHQFNLEIFNPKIYAESYFLPSLGDLLFNIISITWVAMFVYTHRMSYRLPGFMERSATIAVILQIVFLFVITQFAYLTDDIFFGLIYNSRITFDINIINIDWISCVCVLLLCLAWYNLYLFASFFIVISLNLNISRKRQLSVFLIAFLLYLIYRSFTSFTVFFIVFGLMLFLLAYNIYRQNRRFSVLIFSASFFCMALITSVKYIRFADIKERSLRATVARKLETANDPKVINAIDIFERGMASDSYVLNYFKNPKEIGEESLQNHLEKTYFDGFLSRFDVQMFTFNNLNKSFFERDSAQLLHYQQLVKIGALKTPESDFFYRVNDTFGYQNYFGIIPVFNGRSILGTLVVELKSQPYDYNLRFPDLLLDGKVKSESEYNLYSFAFYNNGYLVNQSGKYSYPIVNRNFNAGTGKIAFENTRSPDYSHLVYAPTATKVIVVSKERIAYVTRLAALSFFFLVFISFASVVYMLIWFARRLETKYFDWFSLNKYLLINANRILYKTRIQVSIVLAVVVTLLVVGWTTFYYISTEYRKQQEDSILDKVRKLQLAYEKHISGRSSIQLNEQSDVEFNQFADVNATFLNLYNIQGDLLLTSLPKLFDNGISGRKMPALAYLNLNKLEKSEFINTSEHVGKFTYAAGYVPIRNSANKTIAYLGSPFYNNEADYNSKIGLFINTLINIYALVFVAIGILAVFLANQITNPLTFIQESIRKTKLGQRNQPIHWSRQDEIGSLIKEYNKMIAALEISADKLARSERENAWREMAKQVAHEIKNPLTPLKLGVQLLERSWKEKDPNFEKKFANFNASFIEQIDSLANIASEFSNFAKMPDTKLEMVELLPIIEQAKNVFKHTDFANITIKNTVNRSIHVLGDKDQLLRTFNNLFKNAIEATAQGKITNIKIIISENIDHIVIAVSDNGKGIGPDQHMRIFTPNFTTKSSGTGLGLAFVKQAIENAGGSVSFSSEINKGTTFLLTFPIQASANGN